MVSLWHSTLNVCFWLANPWEIKKLALYFIWCNHEYFETACCYSRHFYLVPRILTYFPPQKCYCLENCSVGTILGRKVGNDDLFQRRLKEWQNKTPAVLAFTIWYLRDMTIHKIPSGSHRSQLLTPLNWLHLCTIFMASKYCVGCLWSLLFLLPMKEVSEEDKDKEENAAVKIQAVFRGHLARKQVKQMKKGDLQEENTQGNNWGDWLCPPQKTWKNNQIQQPCCDCHFFS